MFNVLLVGVFCTGYFFVTLEHKVGVNKAAFVLLMAVFSWALIFIGHASSWEETGVSLSEHLADISQVMIFLMGAMTIVELISSYQGFRLITDFIKTQNKRVLFFLLTLMTFFLSALLDNMTTAIIMVSLMRQFIPEKQERMIFASMIIIAANAGGAWSPIGDVTTTMLWIGGQISSGKIIQLLFIPSLISVLFPLLYLSRLIKGSVVMAKAEEGSNGNQRMYGARRVFALGMGALIFVPVLRSLTGLPPYMGMLLGLGAMWLLTDLIHQERHFLRVPHILTKIDISSVLFFLGILLSVAALETAGLLTVSAQWLDRYFHEKDIIVTLMGLLSSIIDNVPLTAASMGMYSLDLYPMDSKIWEMLAFAVGTGGSILIIGSAAGVVVMGMEKISFGWYLKKISLPTLIGYFMGIGAFLLIYKLF